jgi:hypothetical protein
MLSKHTFDTVRPPPALLLRAGIPRRSSASAPAAAPARQLLCCSATRHAQRSIGAHVHVQGGCRRSPSDARGAWRAQLASKFPEELRQEIDHLAYEKWAGLNKHGIMLKTQKEPGARWLVLATDLLAKKERCPPESPFPPCACADRVSDGGSTSPACCGSAWSISCVLWDRTMVRHAWRAPPSDSVAQPSAAAPSECQGVRESGFQGGRVSGCQGVSQSGCQPVR